MSVGSEMIVPSQKLFCLQEEVILSVITTLSLDSLLTPDLSSLVGSFKTK